MKTILVTGGAGFIGSHLCEELAKNPENKVYSLDNYSTGSEANHVANVEYINGDTQDIQDHIKFSPDIVYHLGEYSRVEQSFDDIEKVWCFNKIGTFSVLQFCREHASKIVYAGSSTKFGDGGLGRRQSPYGWTKASNTELVENFGDWFNVPYSIVYFYNAYGPREIRNGKYATLIAIFAEKMKKGDKLTVVSPGEQKRNFTHVKDIVSGLILVGENGFGDEFGIGHPASFSVLDVAKIFGGEINMIPERRGNRMAADVVSDKTRALGWEPIHNLETYIDSLRSTGWES
ncbi:NAD-dependent epimerase/dehydratase family protein [Marinobacterium sp. xm-d-564]|uniref:NAD-dependent epimerase/dehydratase family protein n=1 Tax=Marinobacterium sp. xm-d-564 TaxID=2497742 RepID=UPI001568E3AF|nr:NAD-dependent epimerase/dehydratase family protein [Marinobacterium sp. xm-d-564]NRP60349.1 dTDP-L-rhamnose 4-epimerase [Marinobacterium sp. xm-d-564]